MLEGPKLYTQLGNAVNPMLVEAVMEAILEALAGDGGLPRTAPMPPEQQQQQASAPAKAPSSAPKATTATRPCEDHLCAASVNLLRGVTPPRAHDGATEKQPEMGAEAYGRYGHESPAERLRRVRERPVDRLFCMRCEMIYPMDAQAAVTS